MISEFNYHRIENNYEDLRSKKVVIWCRSVSALDAYRVLNNRGINVIGFTDSFADKEGETFAGLPVYTMEELHELKNIAVYIATTVYQNQLEILERATKIDGIEVYAVGLVYGSGKFDIVHMKQVIETAEEKIRYVKNALQDRKSEEVFNRLLEYRVTNDIGVIPEICERGYPQYFPQQSWFCPQKDEIFVDAGAYNGQTSLDFIDWARGQYSKIYLMEPDPLMFEIMKEYVRLKGMERTIPIGCGAYSYTGELCFAEDSETGSSMVSENGGTVIQSVAIDDMLSGGKATFIKMDIEGSEMEALKGAKHTIEEYKPKLAISVYHREDDLWEIPYYILTNYPWYRIYFRHYTMSVNETVMFAVP